MKFNFLISFVLLSCMSCYGVASKMERVAFPTKITDLNFDVIFVMFDNLEFAELLNIAQAHSKLQFIAKKIFVRKYGEYKIQAREANNHYRGEEECEISEEGKYIKIYEYQTILETLKVFGSVIRKVHINNNSIEKDRLRKINRLINQHAAASLTHFNLHFIKNDTLQQLYVPFVKVENLVMHIDKELSANIKSLDQMFPNLKKLKILFYIDVDCNFIDCAMPYLEHLNVGLYLCDGNARTMPPFKRFF